MKTYMIIILHFKILLLLLLMIIRFSIPLQIIRKYLIMLFLQNNTGKITKFTSKCVYIFLFKTSLKYRSLIIMMSQKIT